jgi:hypothetical protein
MNRKLVLPRSGGSKIWKLREGPASSSSPGSGKRPTALCSVLFANQLVDVRMANRLWAFSIMVMVMYAFSKFAGELVEQEQYHPLPG